MGNTNFKDDEVEDNDELENEMIISEYLPPTPPSHFTSEEYLSSKRALSFPLSHLFRILSLNTPTSAAAKVKHDCYKYRMRGIVQIIERYKVEIICLQEPHYAETLLLASCLPDFEFFGRGRNADNTSEFQPIFWKKERFEVEEKGVFWHSDSPFSPPSEASWDAACIRHSVWVKLKDKVSDKMIMIVNTHWDHKGHISRSKTASLYSSLLPTLRCRYHHHRRNNNDDYNAECDDDDDDERVGSDDNNSTINNKIKNENGDDNNNDYNNDNDDNEKNYENKERRRGRMRGMGEEKKEEIIPIIICGDFNDSYQCQAIRSLRGLSNPLTDFKYPISLFGVEFFEPLNGLSTYPGWLFQFHSTIDYMLYDGEEIMCYQYGTIADRFISGRVISDHRPVFGSFCFSV